MDSKKIRERVTKNIGVKVAALLLAIFVWFYISRELSEMKGADYEQKTLRDVEVVILGRPLQFSNVLFDVKLVPASVNVAVRGPRDKIIDLLHNKNFTVYADIKGLKLDREYPLPVQVILPSDVTLIGEPDPAVCRVILSTKK